MNACVNTYEMRMPAHYVDMIENELAYDGGWDWGAFVRTVFVAAVITTAIALTVATAGLAVPALGAAIGITTVEAAGISVGVSTLTGIAGGAAGYAVMDALDW